MVQQIKFIIELFIQTFKPFWHLAIIISFSTYFFLNPLETWYRYIGFQGLRVYWHCPFSCAIQTLDIAAILILSLIFYYWHNIYWKRLCQICGHFESVHQQMCLSVCTVFFKDATKIQNGPKVQNFKVEIIQILQSRSPRYRDVQVFFKVLLKFKVHG